MCLGALVASKIKLQQAESIFLDILQANHKSRRSETRNGAYEGNNEGAILGNWVRGSAPAFGDGFALL